MNNIGKYSVIVEEISASPLNPNFLDPLTFALFKDERWKAQYITQPSFNFRGPAPKNFFVTDKQEKDFKKSWENNIFYAPKISRLIYSLEMFERDLALSDGTNAFAISCDSMPIPCHEINGDTNLEKFKSVASGANFSCRLLELDRFAGSPEICKVRDELVNWLGGYVHATAFYSCPGQSVIPLHWDTENLIIYQAFGRKKWVLGKPKLENPMRLHNPGSLKGVGNDFAEDGLQITLEQGDFLYVPRGWFHKATADESLASLHITFGISSATILDNIIDVIESGLFALSQNESLRASVNTHDPQVVANWVKSALAVIQGNVDRLSQKSFADEWRFNFPLGRYKVSANHFEKLQVVIEKNSTISFTNPTNFKFQQCSVTSNSYMYFEGIKVNGPHEAIRDLEALIARDSFRPNELLDLVGPVASHKILLACLSSGELKTE